MTDFDDVTQQIALQNSIEHFANSFDDGKVQLKRAFDLYIPAVTNVLEWCYEMTPLLNQLINANDDNKPQVAARLDDGMQKLQASQQALSSSISKFNPAIGSTGTLLYQIVAQLKNKTSEITRETRQIYRSLESKVKSLNADVTHFKSRFRDDGQSIADMRMQTENTQTFLSLNEHADFLDDIRKNVKKLITQCKRFCKKHESK